MIAGGGISAPGCTFDRQDAQSSLRQTTAMRAAPHIGG